MATRRGHSMFAGGVPPINELPKRRLIATASSRVRSDASARCSYAKRKAKNFPNRRPAKSMADRAKEIADYIDVLDERVFGGILIIGGLVAIFNPLAERPSPQNLFFHTWHVCFQVWIASCRRNFE